MTDAAPPLSSPFKIGIAGCAGRMGRLLAQHCLDGAAQSIVLGGGSVHNAAQAGQDVGALAGAAPAGIAAVADPEALFSSCDAVIDFTAPEATRRHVWLAAKHHLPLVVGTTGLSREDEAELADAAREAPLLYAPNMSLGVTLMTALTEKVAAALGPEAWDIEIGETHHRHKLDAPSGTALALGRAAARGRGRRLDEIAVHNRRGHTGAREAGSIGFSVRRGGDIAGEHTVSFFGDGERFELSHAAGSRLVFARGALRAALWLRGRPQGLYTMRDVLGI
jgi:4-hydroxy-tetrahydrodipicolinate reductase